MRPEPGQVLHFSEDPTITRFVPHVAATSAQPEAYVWAVDGARAPDYWFPRACPRAMAWTTPDTSEADRERIIGPGGGERLHAIEYRWLEPMRRPAVRLPAARRRLPAVPRAPLPRVRRDRPGDAAGPRRARRRPVRAARRGPDPA